MKYAILSTDNNPDYYNLLPIVCYSWIKLGYTPVIIGVTLQREEDKNFWMTVLSDTVKVFLISPVDGVKDSTIAQLSRLFAYKYFNDDDILITGDADMVIDKNIFNDSPEVHSYGFDLTGRSEIPICYVSASAANWRKLMGEYVIPDAARSQQWKTFWSVDQQLLTKRAREYGFDKITFLDRGNNNKHGLPTGRWDRHDFAHIPDDIIDVHMPRNNWDAQFQVFKRLWPGDDVKWLYDYKDKVEGTKTYHLPAKEFIQPYLDELAEQYPWFLESISNWSNHRPCLLLALSLTTGKVTELGSGDGSTPFLEAYCKQNSRRFYSFESNKQWADNTGAIYIEDWNTDHQWTKFSPVLFVDLAPGEYRWEAIRDMATRSQIIVVHDSERGGAGNYQLDRVYGLFKYILHYNETGGGAGACLLSNEIDVTVYKGLTLGAFRFDD